MSVLTLKPSELTENGQVEPVASESNPQQLWDLLASMWIKLRSSHMISGQPRGEKSCESVSLAQRALSIAYGTTDTALHAEAHRMMAYALNGNEQYEDSIHHYELALESLELLVTRAVSPDCIRILATFTIALTTTPGRSNTTPKRKLSLKRTVINGRSHYRC